MKIRYFDHAATTAVRMDVIKSMLPYLGSEYGNPSSVYQIGRRSKKAIEEARKTIANCINCKPNEIYFTSCGSESDNLAIKGIMYANKEKGKHLITSKIEHPAVLNTCKFLENEGYEVSYVNVDENGKVKLDELQNLIRNDTVLITIMYANNEIGTIQPIKEIAKIARKNNIIFHTDAVQAAGNVNIDIEDLDVSALSISAHKFYGPKGMGALFVKENVKFVSIQNGGHQEKNKRAGTENVASIVGMANALKIACRDLKQNTEYLEKARSYFIYEVEKRIPDVKLNGDRINRLPGNVSFSFKGVDAAQLVLALDEYGICVSSGSACTSGVSEPSHVLVAIGLNEEYIQGTLRSTFGIENTKEDIDYYIKNLIDIVTKMRNL